MHIHMWYILTYIVYVRLQVVEVVKEVPVERVIEQVIEIVKEGTS